MDSNYVIKTYCEEHSKRIDDEQRRQNKKIEKLEKQQEQNTELLLTIRDLASAVEGMQRELSEHNERLKEVEDRDGESWRNVKWTVITAFISACIGYLLHGVI